VDVTVEEITPQKLRVNVGFKYLKGRFGNAYGEIKFKIHVG
jgi:hypothetical protein